MKQFCFLVLTFVGTSATQEVKHAPTVEQCQADQRLWLSKIEVGDNDVSANFTELSGWSREMLDCQHVDPAISQPVLQHGG